jgi:hypothetical protein
LTIFLKVFTSIGQIAIIQLILTGFSIVLLMPLLIFGFTVFFSGLFGAIKADSFEEPISPEDLLAMFNVDGLIPLIIITVILFMFMQTIYTFAAANTHFFKVGSWEAMEASRKVIQKKFFPIFRFIFGNRVNQYFRNVMFICRSFSYCTYELRYILCSF